METSNELLTAAAERGRNAAWVQQRSARFLFHPLAPSVVSPPGVGVARPAATVVRVDWAQDLAWAKQVQQGEPGSIREPARVLKLHFHLPRDYRRHWRILACRAPRHSVLVREHQPRRRN